MEELLSQALLALKKYFPETFEGWRNRVPLRARLFSIEVIHIAHLTMTPILLPAAFYVCARTTDRVLDGWVREDGSVIRLSTVDFKQLIRGLPRLGERTARLLDSVFKARRSKFHCATADACYSALRAYYTDDIAKNFIDAHKIQRGRTNLCNLLLKKGLCEQCAEGFNSEYLTMYCSPWDALPAIFEC